MFLFIGTFITQEEIPIPMIEALTDWNEWWTNNTIDSELVGRPRQLTQQADDLFAFKEIKIITGLRRSGKSTLLYQIVNDLLIRKKISPSHILFINFEDPQLSQTTLEELINTYQTHINPNEKPHLFLDEVHRCKEWALFLRKLYDLRKIQQVFITDSSSKFIKSEYATVITGRAITINVFPLSFQEYLTWKNITATPPFAQKNINKIKHHLNKYLRWGGLPEVILKNSEAQKKILLNDYLSDIVHKDIVERYNVNFNKIKTLVDYLVTNPGALFSPRKYSRTSGMSLDALHTYLGYLEEVFFIHTIPKFSYSLRTQQITPKKIYVSDTGFFGGAKSLFTENIGHLYENAVLINILRNNKEVYYWKDKAECDFIVKEGKRVTAAIQVCSTLKDAQREREMNGLLEAMQKLKITQGVLITTDIEKIEKIGGHTIQYVPLWKYLLM